METPFFTAVFKSTLDAMEEPILDAINAMREHNWISDDFIFYARLCLEEAVVNAIVHGNRSEVKRLVRIELSEEEEKCVIRVFDEGQGFSVEEIPLPSENHTKGRGICIIKHCVDEVFYDRANSCLVMKLKKKCKLGSTSYE